MIMDFKKNIARDDAGPRRVFCKTYFSLSFFQILKDQNIQKV